MRWAAEAARDVRGRRRKLPAVNERAAAVAGRPAAPVRVGLPAGRSARRTRSARAGPHAVRRAPTHAGEQARQKHNL